MTVLDETKPTAGGPSRRARLRTRYNAAMKQVRRAHLYAGLFMTPWVLLYGITAMLFNHPNAFPDRETRYFGPEEAVGTPLEDFPEAVDLAQQIIDVMNEAPTGDDGQSPGTYRLVRPEEVRFNRDLFATAKGEQGEEHAIRLDLHSGKGTVRLGEPEGPEAEQPEPPFSSTEPLELESSPAERLGEGLPQVLEKLDVDGEVELSPRFGPDLEFYAEADDGTVWQVSYPLTRGTLSGKSVDAEGDSLSTRRFLLRLHLAHTYPSRIDARWFWALAVDAMFVSMIGWAITGLLMWWQMKNVRRLGAIVLVLSAIVATIVALGMHQILTS